VGEKLILKLLVERVAGDPAGHVCHLAQRDLIPVGYVLDVLVDSIIERE
jgi:hypothetical protein